MAKTKTNKNKISVKMSNPFKEISLEFHEYNDVKIWIQKGFRLSPYSLGDWIVRCTTN